MSTNCRNIQLLEPDPPINYTITNDDNSLAVEEGGALALVNGVSTYAVLFTIPKLNADYDFIESDVVPGTGDVLLLEPTMQLRTVDGFTLNLDGAPDSSTYRFNWRVKCTTV